MKKYRLSRTFFARPTLLVAKELLGKFLVRQIDNKKVAVMITEVEAYCGERDLASHARFGPTPRSKIMWGPAGRAYVYMVYGMYFCLNVVTEKNRKAEAVLIRDVQGVNGPGKLCRKFKIDKKFNGEDVVKSKKLWIEDRGLKIGPGQIKRLPRVGIDYSGKYKDKLWRFVLSR